MIELDKIKKRQTARFLDHLRDTGQITERLERDFCRCLGFVFRDVENVFRNHEQTTEQHHEQKNQ